MSKSTGRCVEDLERRQRAWADRALVERQGDMERRIEFQVGYDHRAFPNDCGGGAHGQHGMEMMFLLIGPAGAVQWKVAMPNWVPGNVDVIDTVPGDWPVSLVPANSRIGDVYPVDLGFHSPKPTYEGQENYGRDDCHILPGGTCYYDGSGLNAGPVLQAFLSYGPMAVWSALARYYQELWGERRALGAGDDIVDAELIDGPS